VTSVPQRDVIERAIESLDFLVVMDTMPMEITGYADVVLPECTYLERYDGIRSATNREPSIALRSPAVLPKYDSKPAWWMAKEIGSRLGLEDYFAYGDFEEVIAWQLNEMGSSLEEMKKIGVKNYKRKSGSLYLEPGKPYAFPTPSGKLNSIPTIWRPAVLILCRSILHMILRTQDFTDSIMEGRPCIRSAERSTIRI
jgi:thiosulfate reductase/polysulfide reductase chain A